MYNMDSIVRIIIAICSGLAMGFVIALPVGPAGLEAINRTLSQGFLQGFLVSLGAVSADTFDVVLINFGLFKILNNSEKTKSIFFIICGVILSLLGYFSLLKYKRGQDAEFDLEILENKKVKSMPCLAGFFIGMSNPFTHILWFALSGTAIRYWEGMGNISYYSFIFFTLFGMLLWLALLNYLVLKGYKKINLKSKKASKLISMLIAWCIFGIGAGFIVFGIIKYVLLVSNIVK